MGMDQQRQTNEPIRTCMFFGSKRQTKLWARMEKSHDGKGPHDGALLVVASQAVAWSAAAVPANCYSSRFEALESRGLNSLPRPAA